MIRLALPAGDLRGPLSALLSAAGLPVPGYGEGSRSYRLRADLAGEVDVRVFRERDIPVQIALGNYDLGICGLAWVEELASRYPHQQVVRLRDLPVGASGLYAAVADGSGAPARTAGAAPRPLRIVSEYANLAQALALSLRFPAYRVLPVWGSAQAYPPEDADLALVSAPDEATVRSWGLRPLASILSGCACIIASRQSGDKKDLGAVLAPLFDLGHEPSSAGLRLPRRLDDLAQLGAAAEERGVLRLAVPDGHQQPDAVAALRDAGIVLDGYDLSRAVARPRTNVDGLEAKVIRPQDMAQQVALGSFDLAITGADWLRDHTLRFPSSPAREVVDLQRCRYTIVATVSEDVQGESLAGAVSAWRAEGRGVLRVASEYANIADYYARERHLGRYQVIPIGGASEGFVPEDAEILIEGTETGTTLAANKLKVIDRLFESTSRLVGHERAPAGRRGDLREELVRRFREVSTAATTGGR